MTRRYKLECLGKDVTMVVDKEKGVAFDGWDERIEQSWMAIGGADEPSDCMIIAQAVVDGTLDDEMLKYVKKQDLGFAKALIIAGADVNNAYDAYEDKTPLGYAIKNKDIRMTKMILKEGAFVDDKDDNGWAPLHHAAWYGLTIIATVLFKHNARVNTRSKDGWTPLHAAAANGNVAMVRLLIEKKANVNAEDRWLWTPLHRAAWNGHASCAETLLQHNATLNAKAKDGQTPLDFAFEGGHTDVIELLQNWGEEHPDA